MLSDLRFRKTALLLWPGGSCCIRPSKNGGSLGQGGERANEGAAPIRNKVRKGGRTAWSPMQSMTERKDTRTMNRDRAAEWVVMFADMGTRGGDSFQGTEHAVGIMRSVLQMLTWRCLWGNLSDGGGYLEAFGCLILKFTREKGLEREIRESLINGP